MFNDQLHMKLQCCVEYFQKVFQLQITKHILKSISITFVNYFGHVAQNPKYF